MDYVGIIAGILQDVLGLAGSVTTGQAANVIAILQKVVPVAVETEKALLVPIRNIIVALQSAPLTSDTFAALQAQSNAVDAALDAAARDDGLV